jgi:hypothetical protein
MILLILFVGLAEFSVLDTVQGSATPPRYSQWGIGYVPDCRQDTGQNRPHLQRRKQSVFLPTWQAVIHLSNRVSQLVSSYWDQCSRTWGVRLAAAGLSTAVDDTLARVKVCLASVTAEHVFRKRLPRW